MYGTQTPFGLVPSSNTNKEVTKFLTLALFVGVGLDPDWVLDVLGIALKYLARA